MFCGRFTAAEVAKLMGRQRKTIDTIFNRIRERITEHQERASPFTIMSWRGKRWGVYNGVEFIRGTQIIGECDPIGIFEPAFIPVTTSTTKLINVFAEVLPDRNPKTIKLLNQGKYRLVQVFTYDDLLGSLYYSTTQIGIDDHMDTFDYFFMRRMKSFHGLAPHTRYFHLKENEWRFNNRCSNRVGGLLKLLAREPL